MEHTDFQGDEPNDLQQSDPPCVDCGEPVPKPARGPRSPRCPDCREARARRQNTEDRRETRRQESDSAADSFDVLPYEGSDPEEVPEHWKRATRFQEQWQGAWGLGEPHRVQLGICEEALEAFKQPAIERVGQAEVEKYRAANPELCGCPHGPIHGGTILAQLGPGIRCRECGDLLTLGFLPFRPTQYTDFDGRRMRIATTADDGRERIPAAYQPRPLANAVRMRPSHLRTHWPDFEPAPKRQKGDKK